MARLPLRSRPAAAVRARRFPIRAAVHYRTEDGPWCQGTTENISRNGLLLHATEAINPDTPIDVIVILPSAFAGGPAATMVCRGRVARIVDPIDRSDIVVALALTHCRIGRVEVDAPSPHDSVSFSPR